jgi:hypothetical protein
VSGTVDVVYEDEGVLHREEGRGSLVFRGYEGPLNDPGYERKLRRWTLVVTRVRMAMWSRHGKSLDLPWRDDRTRTAVEITATRSMLVVRNDVVAFGSGSRGTIEHRIRLADPRTVCDLVDELRGVRPV